MIFHEREGKDTGRSVTVKNSESMQLFLQKHKLWHNNI